MQKNLKLISVYLEPDRRRPMPGECLTAKALMSGETYTIHVISHIWDNPKLDIYGDWHIRTMCTVNGTRMIVDWVRPKSATTPVSNTGVTDHGGAE